MDSFCVEYDEDGLHSRVVIADLDYAAHNGSVEPSWGYGKMGNTESILKLIVRGWHYCEIDEIDSELFYSPLKGLRNG